MAKPSAKPVVIAIDGPAASGKGTLARRIATHFGYAYLDTGLLYRAAALRVLRAGQSADDVRAAAAAARRVTEADFDDPELRSDEVARAAGRIAAIPAVRKALLRLQRRFAAHPPADAAGVVLDGRDIGTVICPDAAHKIFVEAAPDVRAERRHKELLRRGVPSIPSGVLKDMAERDARDRGRAVAPLVPAKDAFVLDTTGLDADGTFAAALCYIEARRARE